MWVRAAIAAAWLGGCASGGTSVAALAVAVDQPFVEELAVGSFHTCARLRGGTVRCWGMGGSGQLGDGAEVQRDRPVVVSGIDDAQAIAAEGDRSCAVRSDGSVWCWGHGASAELDDGAAAERRRPVKIPGWREVRQLALAQDHDCAVTGDGQVLCRGANTRGALGNGGAFSSSPMPAAVVRLAAAAEEVAVGNAFSCARMASGEVWCWGWNEHGQCGEGSQRDHLTPVQVPGIAQAQQLVAGADHACALLSDGTASCWGGDTFGQRGDGDAQASAQPRPVLELREVSSVWAGHYRTTAILADGTVYGWGRDWLLPQRLWPGCEEPRAHLSEGRGGEAHGSGPRASYCPRPALLPVAPGTVQLVVAQLHACARTDEGLALCWGSNVHGAIGDGSGVAQATPVAVAW